VARLGAGEVVGVGMGIRGSESGMGEGDPVGVGEQTRRGIRGEHDGEWKRGE